MHNEGEPIPLVEQASLFESFKRASTADQEIGWGLGLTMVKGMVDAHKGTITVESGKETGTKFIIKIPKAQLTSAAEINLVAALDQNPA